MNRTKGKRDLPQEFKLANGSIISDPKEIANAFNDFFISIGDTGLLNANRNIDFNKYMPLKTNCTLIFQAITIDTISKIIDSLKAKTSTGVDSVSNKLLKFAKNAISEPMTRIISQMLRVGIFPDLLKISQVVPVYKKDDNTNYQIIDLFHFCLLRPKFMKKLFWSNFLHIWMISI